MKTIKLNNKEINLIKLAISNNEEVYNQNEYDYTEFEEKFGINMDDVDYMLSDLSDKLNKEFGGLSLDNDEINFIKLSIIMFQNISNELSFEEFEEKFGVDIEETESDIFFLNEKINK